MSKDPQVSPSAMKNGKQDIKEGEPPSGSKASPTKETTSAVADSAPAVPQDVDTSAKPGTSKVENDDEVFKNMLILSSPMNYFNTKNTPFYIQAKAKMQDGDFEAALTIIEKGITFILSNLPEPNEVHESIAPLHYLYGTTLLYSIEESQDNPENSLMAAQAQQDGENAAGDLQIAWENLETARSIIQQCRTDNLTEEEQEEQLMDLAQIHGRLGDLSRHDGHYERAINDYEICCKSRREILKGEKVWSRKIADVEYNLGMTCLSFAAEAEKKLLDELDNENKDGGKSTRNAAVSSIKAQPAQDDESTNKLTPEQISALREKSFRHYVQCCRILAGMIAVICDKNPTEIAAVDDNLEIDALDKKCAAVPEGTKTNGLDATSSVHDQVSAALVLIRERVSKLKPANAEDEEGVHDLREMLDEIQETIDNSETDREGLRDLGIMRKKAEEEANNREDANATSESQSGTTTIGFGKEQKTLDIEGSAGASTSAFTTTASQQPSAVAAPMMVVKKKKKKRNETQSTEDVDLKRLKTG